MSNLNINPLLIHALTGEPMEDIPLSPKIAELPGKYVKLSAKNIKKIPPIYPDNSQPLICKNCRKKAKYNLGHVTINLGKYKAEHAEKGDDYIQSTGYFRCKQCNSAGQWEITNEYSMMAISALLIASTSSKDDRFSFGKNQLFDGSSHKYASDAEEYLLEKIMNDKNDSYLWNRLGNSYYKGGRPDLAAAAFEQSVSIDPFQTESYFSLGQILFTIEPKEAAKQYHKMLLSAFKYTRMDVSLLRDLLSNGLRDLVYLQSYSEEEIPLLPPSSLYNELNMEFQEYSADVSSGEINSEDLESFYPLAEIFMGSTAEQLPGKKVYFAKKKKKKRKK